VGIKLGVLGDREPGAGSFAVDVVSGDGADIFVY
jgi:hypothetical protein